jgi:succinate dehydrogenase/fumarate reductase-like Fe-S protein
MQINVKIKRYNPEADARPYWAEYKLEARGSDRVLDVITTSSGRSTARWRSAAPAPTASAAPTRC